MTTAPYSLDRLHDIVQPTAVPWWPPAAGFWFLLTLLLVWASVAALVAWKRYRRNAYRREGVAHLREIAPKLRAADSRAKSLAELSELLKRTALAAFPRDEVAGLSGADWLEFLDHTGGGGSFSSGPASVMATAPYRSRGIDGLSTEQLEAIIASSRRWILRHSSEGAS